MGFAFSLLYFKREQKNRWFIAVCMIGIPILIHGLWDSMGGLLGLVHDHSSTLVLIFALIVTLAYPFVLLYITIRIIRKTKKLNNKV